MPKATERPTTPAREALLRAPMTPEPLRAVADHLDGMAQTAPQPALSQVERPAPDIEIAGTLPHLAGNLNDAVTGALYTLDLLKSSMLRDAEAMDEGGTVLNWASVIGLVTAAVEGCHEDLTRALDARSTALAVAA